MPPTYFIPVVLLTALLISLAFTKKSTIMAPSLTETETVAEQKPGHLYKLHLGQYKEIDAVFVDKEAEQGKTGEPPAKVHS